ncbi:Aldo/keto reductase [Laetiporus sulphureus 93-53]|uniref:Aldo/keto reductase n=1 Tax=Laetiporus sulphureus 93-53 TaxID=1314785 RepID=A0A165H4K3_9APHY|nr:Aldo/keto reductase [Laetiporus sulphureus 93-53]KZT11235.1 Aldo/keto reductase [Laetiporus sulphureus 93-53]
MVHKTAMLGGTASNVKVAKVAHGLMRMTWSGTGLLPDEQCFEAIKAGVDALPPDVKMFLNSGEFYGPGESTANLELVSRFFEKYPDPEDLRRSVDNINAALRGKKRMDLFQCARVDKNVPIENTIKTLVGLIEEGKFDHISMSECSAQSLRWAHAVHPISVVEIEISPWSYEEETKKVIATTKQLGIAVAGYSEKKRTLENLAGGDVEFSEQELADINAVISKHEITGDRYFGGPEMAQLWG